MIKRADVEKWFNSLPVRADLAELSAEEFQAAVDLIGNPGFGAVWGLLLGSRQSLYATLANLPLAEAAQVNRAAVLQGQIKGIELLFDTLLELASPAQMDAAEGATK